MNLTMFFFNVSFTYTRYSIPTIYLKQMSISACAVAYRDAKCNARLDEERVFNFYKRNDTLSSMRIGTHHQEMGLKNDT